jgi:hypothetical protein
VLPSFFVCCIRNLPGFLSPFYLRIDWASLASCAFPFASHGDDRMGPFPSTFTPMFLTFPRPAFRPLGHPIQPHCNIFYFYAACPFLLLGTPRLFVRFGPLYVNGVDNCGHPCFPHALGGNETSSQSKKNSAGNAIRLANSMCLPTGTGVRKHSGAFTLWLSGALMICGDLMPESIAHCRTLILAAQRSAYHPRSSKLLEF